MDVHLFDFRWEMGETENAFSLVFEATRDDKFGRKRLQIGDEISIEIESDEVSCAGSKVGENWQPCSEKFRGKPKCDLCRARERNFIFTRFDGFNRENFSDADLAAIGGEHWVYLALFSQNLVKVGVSGASRKTIRQLEQGSHATLFFARPPDGILARQIETLFRRTALPDKVQMEAKKNLLCPEISDENAQNILLEIFNSKKNCLQNFPNLEKFLVPPEFKSWQTFYQTQKMTHSQKPLHVLDLSAGESISGRLAAAKGSFLIFDLGDEWACVNVKKLRGQPLDFAPRPAGLVLSSAFQKRMF